jgi:type IV pilus assembly protein PilN
MIKINLVSEGRKPIVARKAKEALGVGQTSLGEALLYGAVLVGIVVCALTWWHYKGEIAERDVAIAEAEREVKELEAVLKEVEAFKKKKAELEHKINVINQLKQNQWGPVKVMDEISAALPDLLWLDSLTLRGKNVELRGQAFNTNQIATFIESLKMVPEFDEPKPPIEITQAQDHYTFSLSFDFAFAPVTPLGDSAEPESTVDG